MALDPSKLSVKELRQRLAAPGQTVSSQVLNRLRRDPRRGVRALYQRVKKRSDALREEQLRLAAMLNFERLLWRAGTHRIAGVDEAGVGPLAGPVVAAAVVFPPGTSVEGVDDSKRVDPQRRQALAERIRAAASGIGVGLAEPAEIDRVNVYQASLLAMRRAVEALTQAPEHVLVDARTIPALAMPQSAFNKGDGINFSIAAASIVAKTYRDGLMESLDRQHPGYGFARHKGYATAAHQQAIRRHGPCAVHRRSYRFIAELCGQYSALFYASLRELSEAGSRAELRELEHRLQAQQAELAEHERRKLRVTLARRWRVM